MISVAVVHNLRMGGARRVMAEQISRLPWDVTEFCLGTAEAVLPEATVVPYTPRARNLSTGLRPPFRYSDFAELLVAWARLGRKLERCSADVILAHPCQFLQAPAALLWTSKASIYFCHEPRRVDYEDAAVASRNHRTRVLYGPLYASERAADRMTVRRCQTLLTNSRFTADAILRAYGREAMVSRLGVPDVLIDMEPDAVVEHVLSVGALIPSKGHDLAIQTVAVSGVELPLLIVASREAPAEEARLSSLARELGVRLKIRIGISDEELGMAYMRSLATLYLARDEPYGLVSIEAQACGCPVIVSRQGGLPETVIEGVTGWAVEREPVAAGNRLQLLANDNVRLQMSAAAMRHGRGFGWQRAIAELTGQIEQALSGSIV